MGAVNLQPIIVEQYEEARIYIVAFHEAANRRDTRSASNALQNAALAICRGLSAAVNDKDFWADAANLINPSNHRTEALEAVFQGLEAASAEEANILMKAGYSSESIGILLGSFDLALRVFREHPTGNSLELARDQVIKAQQSICGFSAQPVVIKKQGFWRRGYRHVMGCFKVFGAVGVIVVDVTSVATTSTTVPVLTPFTVGLAIASVMGGIETISEVGEAILGNVY